MPGTATTTAVPVNGKTVPVNGKTKALLLRSEGRYKETSTTNKLR